MPKINEYGERKGDRRKSSVISNLLRPHYAPTLRPSHTSLSTVSHRTMCRPSLRYFLTLLSLWRIPACHWPGQLLPFLQHPLSEKPSLPPCVQLIPCYFPLQHPLFFNITFGRVMQYIFICGYKMTSIVSSFAIDKGVHKGGLYFLPLLCITQHNPWPSTW